MNEPVGLIERARTLESTAKRLRETNPVFHYRLIRELELTARELRQQARKEAAA